MADELGGRRGYLSHLEKLKAKHTHIGKKRHGQKDDYRTIYSTKTTKANGKVQCSHCDAMDDDGLGSHSLFSFVFYFGLTGP
jgi:hypothetical protein